MENKISKMEFLKSNVSDTNYTKKGEEKVVITSDILEEDKRQIWRLTESWLKLFSSM